MRTWMLSLALVVAPAVAHADQCEWVEPAIAERAQQLLAKHPKVISFCEPCGDKAPGIPAVAGSVTLGDHDVRIDGNPVDLAYTFVQTSPTQYQNLALLAGCEAHDVSSSLKVAEETTTGVLIVPDDAPVAHPPPPPPAPQATPPHVFVFSTYTRAAWPWLTIVLAGIASFTMSLAGILAFARFRRRRAMKPRATNLPVP
ncbi:MAG TPA: hypothetical protein VLB44_05415 [Kofleriaceae bacterium]|nr:hypothetical protein [Kofleriaceae bacterium]